MHRYILRILIPLLLRYDIVWRIYGYLSGLRLNCKSCKNSYSSKSDALWRIRSALFLPAFYKWIVCRVFENLIAMNIIINFHRYWLIMLLHTYSGSDISDHLYVFIYFIGAVYFSVFSPLGFWRVQRCPLFWGSLASQPEIKHKMKCKSKLENNKGHGLTIPLPSSNK